MLGGLLALLSAATFAFSNVSIRRGVITGSVLQGLVVTVPIGIPPFLAVAFAVGSLDATAAMAWPPTVYLALAGILHFVAGRYCNYRAIHAMGANLTAPVQQTGLLVSLALAVGLLGEALTPLRILGIVLVLTGPAIMVRARRGGNRSPGRDATAAPPAAGSAAAAFSPRYAEGYLFALMSAVAYGVSPILIRAALHGAGPGASIAGGLVSYVAATAVIAAVLVPPTARRSVLSVDPRAATWFAVSGVFVCAAQMFRYLALSLAPVTVVTPMMQTSIVFRVMFGWMINRHHEVFGFRMLVGILFSLAGALALTLTAESVLSLVSLPEFVIEAVHWRWPNG